MFCFLFTISSKFLTVSTQEHFQKQIISITSASIIFNGSHQVGWKFVTDCYQQQLKNRDRQLLLWGIRLGSRRSKPNVQTVAPRRKDAERMEPILHNEFLSARNKHCVIRWWLWFLMSSFICPKFEKSCCDRKCEWYMEMLSNKKCDPAFIWSVLVGHQVVNNT